MSAGLVKIYALVVYLQPDLLLGKMLYALVKGYAVKNTVNYDRLALAHFM